MDHNEHPDRVAATKWAFEQLDKWLDVRPEKPKFGDAIPDDDPPNSDPVEAWGGLRFDVPEEFGSEWMSSMRSAFVDEFTADFYQERESEPVTKSSGSSRSRSQSQDKQGAS
jgi:hypothetical protein